ncbi:MAG: hypothetical protein JSV84_08400 [Gemmatimonadota bacterium]|nr:MAG: hypothetical protein JSV84_08400 [Gemmatimonadota bacterium]
MSIPVSFFVSLILMNSLIGQTERLEIVGSSGTPGSAGHVMPIEFDSRRSHDWSAIEFDIFFNTEVFAVDSVGRTQLTRWSEIFLWHNIQDGIKVIMSDIDGRHVLGMGVGPIAEVYLDVNENAQEGTYLLGLAHARFSHPTKPPMIPQEVDDLFTVTKCVELSETYHDFGSVSVVDSVDWVLEICNICDDVVFILSSYSDSFNFFTHGLSFPLILPSHDCQELVVTYASKDFYWTTGRLELSVIHPAEQGLTVHLRGTGAPQPDIIVSFPDFCVVPNDTVRIPIDAFIPEEFDVISAFQMDLLFDRELISATDLLRPERTAHLEIFSWSKIDEGVRIVMSGIRQLIRVGSGPICEILFISNVNDACGQSIDLKFRYVKAGGTIDTGPITVGKEGMVFFSQKGDVNFDCEVDVFDVIGAGRFLLGLEGPSFCQRETSDIDNSGEIEINDIIDIVHIILNSSYPNVSIGPSDLALDREVRVE